MAEETEATTPTAEGQDEPMTQLEAAATYLQKNTRPILAVVAYGVLAYLEYLDVHGVAVGLPAWYSEAFVALSFVMCGGWEVLRELWKRKTGQ